MDRRMKKHLRFIRSYEYASQLRDYLERLPFDVLLKIVVTDPLCAQLVLRWVEEGGMTVGHSRPFRSDTGLLDRLPYELWTSIFKLLYLKERISVSQTCRECLFFAGSYLQHDITVLLSGFHLNASHMRFLMTASSTVLGGAAIPWLIHSDSRRKLRIIDLFTSQGDGLLVCDFIVSTTPYSTGTHPDTVTEMWTLRVLSFGNRKIRVFESFTTAMSALSRCNTTAFMGFVDGRSLRHAYPGLMDARIAITTPSQLPIESTLEDHQSIWRVLKRTRERGYKVETELPFTHSCGHHPDCPATLRTSCDSGWLNISLPAVHYGSSGDRPGTCWSLFGTGCKRGILDGGDTISVVAHEDVPWYTVVVALLQMEEEPAVLVGV